MFTYGMRVRRPQSFSKLDYTIDDLPRSNLKARYTFASSLEAFDNKLSTISVGNLRTRDKHPPALIYYCVCIELVRGEHIDRKYINSYHNYYVSRSDYPSPKTRQAALNK